MYRLLTLDDLLVERRMLCEINWEAVGISSITYAGSLDQLKAAFDIYPYELVIINIDHFQSDWMIILQWLKVNRKATQIILESMQTDFNYAKTALDNDCYYILTPCPPEEFTATIQKAVQGYDKRMWELTPVSEYEVVMNLWRFNLANTLKLFWMDIIDQKIQPIKSEILKEVERRGIFFLYEGRYSDFIVIIINIRSSYKDPSIIEPSLLQFALINIADELLPLSCTKSQTFELEDGILICMMQITEDNKYSKAELLIHINQFIENCDKYFNCKVHCYVGYPAKCHDISQIVGSLLDMCHNYVYNDSGISLLEEYHPSENVLIVPPNLNLWATLLQHGNHTEIITQIYYYFNNLATKTTININVLYQFHHVFNQMVYTVLKQAGIRGHYLFSDSVTVGLYYKATHSIDETVGWCEHILDKSIQAIISKEKELTLTDKVKKYIHDNVSLHLTRYIIAKELFVNADYLGRIFKLETGKNVSQYITEERIEFAKELLSKGKLSVSDVALEVGFTNFSYFSKVFKELTGVNPAEYKTL